MRNKKNLMVAVLALMTALSVWGNHPWLSRVYEYRPAPGQFVNTMPVARVGEPMDSIIARCNAAICGRVDTITQTFHGQIITQIDTVWAESMISLGGYGGYVIVGFDHPVVNMHTWDFDIMGNAFISERESGGGSCEPGIVMVGVDADGDGVPSDGDRWYELAGSEYDNPKTQHDYTITYYRPDETKPRTPSTTDPDVIDTSYIQWNSNDINPDSTSGYMSRNRYHMQPYWPLWLRDQETLTYSGSKLRCNAVDLGGNDGRSYFVQYFFDWGYADNQPNNPYHQPGVDGFNPGFKIDWAVDEQGRHVNLTHINFIKVYNAVNQDCGWLGETSTEVAGAVDFHPNAEIPASLHGDVDGDGEVTVSDINAIIATIVTGKERPEADVNRDNEVGISDVNAVIDIILQ